MHWYHEQADAENDNCYCDPHTDPKHFHGMASGPTAACSVGEMTYSIT
jgi:hypothetical protein